MYRVWKVTTGWRSGPSVEYQMWTPMSSTEKPRSWVVLRTPLGWGEPLPEIPRGEMTDLEEPEQLADLEQKVLTAARQYVQTLGDGTTPGSAHRELCLAVEAYNTFLKQRGIEDE